MNWQDPGGFPEFYSTSFSPTEKNLASDEMTLKVIAMFVYYFINCFILYWLLTIANSHIGYVDKYLLYIIIMQSYIQKVLYSVQVLCELLVHVKN